MMYIMINGHSIPYPNGFEMQKVPNIVCEITTMSGKTIADINGWKYADTTLEWDTLIDEDLQNLLAAVAIPSFNISFTDIDGTTNTVEAVFRGITHTKTPLFHNGKTIWQKINVALSFPNCYQ